MATFQFKDILEPFRNKKPAEPTMLHPANQRFNDYPDFKPFTPIPNADEWREKAKKEYTRLRHKEMEEALLFGSKLGGVLQYDPNELKRIYMNPLPSSQYQWSPDPYEAYSKDGDHAIEVLDKLTILPVPESIEAVRKELSHIEEQAGAEQTSL